eukprot:TRINITY_DN6740_c0_g1_i2.p1 TRINITY_DN6740_c0_g1~~TRINITY_DN6740_c0_g1_i2.p1  ORF type:complete len:81 (+),score=5.94 TRINITY_DN6740_c0_g1_i2:142-384(+)
MYVKTMNLSAEPGYYWSMKYPKKMHLFYQEKKGVEHLARLADEVISGEHIPLFKIKPKTELRSIKKHNRFKKRTIFCCCV